jgi:hypothetical protein
VELREKEAPFYRGRYAAAKTTGAQTDKAHCIFCGATFVATAGLIRFHVARAEGHDVATCKGVTPREDEVQAAFDARQAACRAANGAMADLVAKKTEEAVQNEAKQTIDRLTSGTPQCVPAISWFGVSLTLPARRAKLKDAETWLCSGVRKAQEDADKALSLALVCAGVAPNVMECPEVKDALRLVALVGKSYKPPPRRARLAAGCSTRTTTRRYVLACGRPRRVTRRRVSSPFSRL